LQALKASVERKAPEVQGQNTSSTAGSSEQNSQVSEMRNVVSGKVGRLNFDDIFGTDEVPTGVSQMSSYQSFQTRMPW
jgi:hypothetical protein